MTDHQERKILLGNSRLFRNFDDDIIEAVCSLLTPCSFESGNLICLKEDSSDCLYIIREGEVEVSISSSEGKVILLGLLSRGDVFGEVGLLDKGTRTATVSTKSKVSLYRLESQDFDKITPLFGVKEWMALTAYICFLFRGVVNNLEEAVFLDAGIRIASKIRNLYETSPDTKDSNSFSLNISQENLGRMAGLSREATNKALSELEQKCLIERKYKRINIPDLQKFLTLFEPG
ncbi:MAG: hypothetical protein CO040_04710 [Candidatus Pacebacteria bacterium CG_4_9_14_0_2_um_filter_36_8]|nr:MAG: hypothetical protein CO093_10650 [Alphaproteobacteria bacterium CG_4_9_14_3_um_filter_47_13]PJC42382.1 MAG: hypothetical protein CO040_04710 [Candidatus Pacebacteria bacterium CG_4_9_14_0_2_um_filter_36_8]